MNTYKKLLKFLIIAIFLNTLNGCCHIPNRLELRAPSVLPHTTRQMKTAGFWIEKIAEPDRVVLNPQAIDAFNTHTQDQGKLITDITRLQPAVKGAELVADFRESLNSMRRQPLFLASGKKASGEFFDRLAELMNVDAVLEEASVRYGLVVHYTDQRILPTTDALMAREGDVDFDELQNSSLDVGEPVAILHQSRDGRWLYCETRLTQGWVQAQDIAVADISDVKRYAARDHFVVVTSAKADIFLDRQLTRYYDYARMGMVLPLLSEHDQTVEVAIPTRNPEGTLAEVSGYLTRRDISVGFLPYTQRNMIDQAFKLLNSPYGWGGMYGEQDCSRFVQEVFSTVGIVMPRNSGQQAQVGVLAASFSAQEGTEAKSAALRNTAIPGITTFYMKGHIMLYLGSVEGRPYAIHAPWGYREESSSAKEAIRVLNRVVVSDLSLGEGSRKGSLLERLLSVRRVDGLAGE